MSVLEPWLSSMTERIVLSDIVSENEEMSFNGMFPFLMKKRKDKETELTIQHSDGQKETNV